MRKRNAKQAALVPKENKSPVVEEIIEDNSPSEEEFSFRELDSDEEYDDHSEQDDLSDSTDGQESEEDDCDDETDEEEQEDDDENNEDEADDDVDSGEEEDEDSEEFSDVEDNLSNVTASLKKLNNLAKSQKVIQNKRSKKKANYSATNEKVSFVRKNEAKQHDSNKAEIVRAKNVIKNGTQVDIENPVASKLSQSQGERDEYASDSSDEEDTRNTVGNVPMKWYDGYDHVGYNWDGKKILKPEKGDQLENFLKRMEDPDFWRTVKDYQTGQDVVLSEADIELITRIQRQRIPDAQFDEYAPWVEWFTSEVMKTPLRKFPEHKRSFLPSKSEAQKVSKLVHALKMGWIKSSAQLRKERAENNANEPQFYMLWKTDDQAEEMRRIHKHIPAPKRFLPGHAESYNPPSEYLFDNRELKEWHKLKSAPWKRKLHFIPQKFDSLRNVPAYPRYTKERFQRCLDLYLCPRAIKMKLTIEPEELVPQLPSPKDLQPFPTTQSIIYKGHTDMVRCMTVEASGQYLATGGDDNTLRVWEISTGRCLRVVQCGGVVRSVAWCPNQNLPLIAVAADDQVLLINSGVGDHLIAKKADKLLEIIPETDSIVSERVKAAVQWQQITETDNPDQWKKGIRIILKHFKIVKQVTWHGKGDYFSTVMPDGQNRSILIHQLSKRKSFIPIGRPRGQVQCVLFHPIKPFFFVATQRHIRIYDLTQQEMIKKLLTGSQWISSMSIHPGGDNLIVGTYDRKLLWFDLDLSTKPYQTLRLHGTGIRGVAYHKRYPLFASGSDDKSLIVCHGMVYNDLLQNPLIVPLKRLCNHETFNDFGILDVMFHPIQPWVFSAGADSTIRLYT